MAAGEELDDLSIHDLDSDLSGAIIPLRRLLMCFRIRFFTLFSYYSHFTSSSVVFDFIFVFLVHFRFHVAYCCTWYSISFSLQCWCSSFVTLFHVLCVLVFFPLFVSVLTYIFIIGFLGTFGGVSTGGEASLLPVGANRGPSQDFERDAAGQASLGAVQTEAGLGEEAPGHGGHGGGGGDWSIVIY